MRFRLDHALVLLLALAAGGLALLHEDWTAPDGDPRRWLAAGLALLAWLALCAACLRRRPAADEADATGLLVAYASQTGSAERLAAASARLLRTAGAGVRLVDLRLLTPQALAEAERVLLIVSTTGEGDPPDDAVPFLRRFEAQTPGLGHLRYGLLSLGDRRYAHFCGFGRALARRLEAAGAAALFDAIEVDNGDVAALARWQAALSSLSGQDLRADMLQEPFVPMRLGERRLLNPGSSGGPIFHLELEPEAGAAPPWAAGDIAEIRTPSGPIREYSIASTPGDRRVHLVVRQQRHADGYGLGSGWLTRDCAIGAAVPLRVRRNSAFHAPPDASPMLLIGNGTGIAGLRAHLRASASRGHWLVYGERQRLHDALYQADVEDWMRRGVLSRVDRVFSRDPPAREYVQDRLRQRAPVLRDFVAKGAWIYVCGSREGMAPGVDAALRDVLGEAEVERLQSEGRYRRDVY